MTRLITLKRLSDEIQRFPLLWRLAIRIYGVKPFIAEKVDYLFFDAPKIVSDQKKNYRLVFDGQCFQTLTRQRGIGKYSLKLVKAICEQAKQDNFAIVLTGIAAPKDIEVASGILKSLQCPNLDIFVFNPFHDKERVSYKRVIFQYKTYLESLGCSWVIGLSNFEKVSDAIPLPLSSKFQRVGILYDLIPMQYPKQLLISNKQKSAYASALESLKEFDLLLSISEETKSHWKKLIGNDERVVVIFGGVERHHECSVKTFSEKQGLLCVGAEMPHKNIERLIKAYSLLNKETQLSHGLTVVGIRARGARKRLQRIARNCTGKVTFTEYLSDDALRVIYEDSRVLVMPSLVEGLSLPILEAWSHGTVAVGSRGTVAEELICNTSLLFDARDASSIASVIQNCLQNEALWKAAQAQIPPSLKQFTWENTAALSLQAILGASRE